MEWWRLYNEIVDDPKMWRLSDRQFRDWANIGCIANKQAVRGFLPPMNDVAFSLRVKESQAQKKVKDLVAAGLIDEIEPGVFKMHSWENRQRESDDVSERVKRYRERVKPVTSNVTSNASVTVTRADAATDQIRTETETEQKKKNTKRKATAPADAVAVDVGFDEFYRLYPRKKAPERAKAAWKKALKRARTDEIIAALKAQLAAREFSEDPTKIPYPGSWLNAGCWQDEITAGRSHAQIGASEPERPPEEPEPVTLWIECPVPWEDLQHAVSPRNWETWLKPCRVLEDTRDRDGQLLVQVPNRYFANWYDNQWPVVLSRVMETQPLSSKK